MCNLKPSKMRGIMSEAMVMCASTPDKVEILTPPEGSAPGDLVQVSDFSPLNRVKSSSVLYFLVLNTSHGELFEAYSYERISVLCCLGFIKRQLEIQKVKSTADASKKIKTNHHKAFFTTHQHLSHP